MNKWEERGTLSNYRRYRRNAIIWATVSVIAVAIFTPMAVTDSELGWAVAHAVRAIAWAFLARQHYRNARDWHRGIKELEADTDETD